MAYYYYDDYDPGPSYYDPEPDFYAPSEYDAYYEDPGPEPAFDDYHPASYDDAHGSPLYHAENIPPTPYDFLADEPLPDDHYEADYVDPRDPDYDNAAQSPVYAADPYLAPYDFLADQPLDWEDDDDDFEAPYAAGFADDAAEDVGTPLGEELSCAGDGEYTEDDFADEYDAEADRLAAAFDATMRGIPISEAYGLGPQQDHALVGDGAATNASYRGRNSPSFTEEYDAEADQLAAEFDMCWQFGIPIPRAWKALEAGAEALETCEDEASEAEDGFEAVDESEECVWRRGEHEYVAGPLPSSSSFYTDSYHDNDALDDDEYAPYAPQTDFWTGACTLDDRLHALAMQSTARRLAFEYRSLPDPIPHLRPLSPYPDDPPAPELDDAAYEDELVRYGDAFAAFARMPIPAVPEPSPPPLYSGFQESEVCEYDTDALPWSDDNDECLDECIEALRRMQLAGYYPDCFDAAPLNLYDADVPELTHTNTLPTYLVSDARRSFFGLSPSRRRPGPSRIPRFRLPRPRNTGPPRRKRPPDKQQRADASQSRRNRRQPRSRTPTRPRRDPPPHLTAGHTNKPTPVDSVALPDEAVPPDRHVPVSNAAKVADAVTVVREPVPPDKRREQLTVEQRRRNALRRMARKKPK